MSQSYFVEVDVVIGVTVKAENVTDACQGAGARVREQLASDDVEVIDVEVHLDEVEQVGMVPTVRFVSPSLREV